VKSRENEVLEPATVSDLVVPKEPAAQRASAAPGAPSRWTRLAYGLGAVANGVKDNGLGFFLLIFYTQVIGVDAALVGLAITVALVVDAISDPVVGYWSDNVRSKWGRRHPFMYAAAVPVAASYYLLWNPPAGWPQEMLFWYVLGLAIFIRTAFTFYETPSAALVPELTENYDQRSSLFSYAYYFRWTGGNAMSVLMFMVLFPAFVTATIANGQFNREAYAVYGIIASALIFSGIMICALGTHSRIAHLKPPPPKRTLTLLTIFKEIFETLSNRSFVALFGAAMFGAVAAGLAAALTFYMSTFFWGFSPMQIGIQTLAVFLSAVIGATLAPVVTRTIGKKRGAIIVGLVAFVGQPLPIVLRLADLLPEGPTPFVFWFVLITATIDVGLIICFQILAAAMMADLVEQAELKTGRRSEGIFFAASTFINKMMAGLGVMTATLVLTLAQFPKGADPSQVPPDAIWRLGAYYVPTILVLWMAMMAVISTYRLDRAGHEENLRQLAERKNKPGL